MQPMINIALRAIRATNEQIQFILDREELSFSDPEKLKRVITRVDNAFHDDLTKALQRAYPNHHIARKGDLKGNPKGYSWHIMPVHNTTGLARGLGDWGFSVLCKKNDQPEHAIVILPRSGDEFTASRGAGASHNGRRLRVSPVKDLSLTLLSTNLLDRVGDVDDVQPLTDSYVDLARHCFGLRSAHCLPLELCRVASGSLDATILFDVTPQDLAAGLLIAREAGALFSDTQGKPLGDRASSIVCCNPKLLKLLAPRLQLIGKPRKKSGPAGEPVEITAPSTDLLPE